MKRSPMPQRKTPLARTGELKRRKRIKQRRAKPRRASAVTDTAYRVWVATLPCAACGRRPAGTAHHNTYGRGAGQKTPDSECMPLCEIPCHRDFHGARGFFDGWDKIERRAWQQTQVAYTQTIWALGEGGRKAA